MDADDNVDWLFEQVDVHFDLSRTKIAPLQSGNRTVGVIIFELRHPVGGDIAERFGPAARFGGAILDMLGTISSQQWYAERFAQALSKTPDARHQTHRHQTHRHKTGAKDGRRFGGIGGNGGGSGTRIE